MADINTVSRGRHEDDIVGNDTTNPSHSDGSKTASHSRQTSSEATLADIDVFVTKLAVDIE
jgi:hypothetical protein